MSDFEINLKNPKTCNHCSAYQHLGGHPHHPEYARGSCYLGYEVEVGEDKYWAHFTRWDDIVVNTKPAEPCPKPKNRIECALIRTKIDVHRKHYKITHN